MEETTSLVEIVAVPIQGFEEGNSQQSQIASSSSSSSCSSSSSSSSSSYGEDDDNDIVREEANKEKKAPISLDGDWVSSIKEKLLIEQGRLIASATSMSCSIHRVPHSLRCIYNENSYVPQIVSIGPFHYEKRRGQLQAMEEHKWRYLIRILSRNGSDSLERYLVAVKELEERARKCYSEEITLRSNTFVEMMVLDGCFMIELFRKYWHKDYNDDPIFQMEWVQTAVQADLVMLENQIPFFILQCLFDLIDVSCPSPSLLDRAIYFLDGYELDQANKLRILDSNIQIQHLLHLIHTNLVLFTDEKCSEERYSVMIPCASKLEEGGITFRKRHHASNFLDIKFHKGVIEIPHIEVGDKTNITFLNLIAFERCYCPCKKYISAYTMFMDFLINTGKDVEILSEKGIISIDLGNEERVAALFNNMGRELTLRYYEIYLSGVCNEINQYCESAWPKLRASLVHDYFKNPWAIISFIAALVLLLLTMTQTFFSSFPKFAYGG